MNSIAKLLNKLFPALNPFNLNTLEDIIQMDMEKTIKEKADAEHTIRTHQFQAFMAAAKLDAMTAWLALDKAERTKKND